MRGDGGIVLDKASIPDGGAVVVRVDERLSVAVFRLGDGIFAIDNRCPHRGGSFADGALDGAVVACPLHGFAVDVRTGRSPDKAFLRVRTFAVEDAGATVRIVVPPAG